MFKFANCCCCSEIQFKQKKNRNQLQSCIPEENKSLYGSFAIK